MPKGIRKSRIDGQAVEDYRLVRERIAPFVVPKPIKPVSTAGQWRDSAAGSSCGVRKK